MQKCKGLSMIEVFVAIAILTLTAITVLKYQLLALQRVQEVNLQSLAINQIQNFLEQLYVMKNTKTRQVALSQWNQQNQHLLPNSVGELHCSQITCQVTLQWHYKRHYSLSLDG